MDKFTKYLLNQILKYKNEEGEKIANDFLQGELILALSKYKKSPKADTALDEFTEYLLSTIEEYLDDTNINPEEKEINELVINELVQALAEYQDFIKEDKN